MLGLIIANIVLSLCSGIQASCFTTIPGENLWRMTSQIGDCVDLVASKVCELEVDVTFWGSILEEIDDTVHSVEDMLLQYSSHLASIGEVLSSQIDAIGETITEVLISDIELIQSDILSLSDTVTSLIEQLDETIVSNQELLSSQLAVLEDTVSSEIAQMSACLYGRGLTQADFQEGTLVLDSPGIYTICEGIVGGGDPVIQITGDDVVLDLNGNTIAVVGNVGIDIISGVADTIIKNGRLVGSTTGIQAVDASSLFIQDIHSTNLLLTISGCNAVTVERYTGWGINSYVSVTNNSYDVLITDSVVFGNTTGGFPPYGFYIILSSVTLEGCSVYQASDAAFLFDGFDVQVDNVVSNCYAVGAEQGYAVSNYASGYLLCDRCIAENAEYGFILSNDNNLLFRECDAYGCSFGFSIGSSNNTVIKRCSVTNNITGITIDADSSNTEILDTCVVNNGTDLVDDGIDTTFINLGTVLEILCSKIEALDDTLESQLENVDEVLISFSDTALSILDVVGDAATCLVGTAISQADIPYTIPGPGVYTLCESVTYNDSPVITNSFNNVTIHLGGNAITTDNQGIVSTANGVSNITISGGTITAGLEGIVLANANGVVVRNVVVYMPADVGIYASDVQGLLIEQCIVEGNNGTTVGAANPGAFYIQACGTVVIRDCIASGLSVTTMPVAGFSIDGLALGGGIELQNCIAQMIGDNGFRIGESSGPLDTVLLKNCSAIQAGDGFVIIHTTGSNTGPILEGCVAESSNRGFVVTATTNTLFKDCIASSNSDIGFLMNSSTDATVASLCVSNNNLIGFEIDGTDATLDRCSAVSNALNGFNLDPNTIRTILHQCFASQNRASGIVDGGVATTIIVDSRSQDAAFDINPPYNLNTAADNKAASTVVRIS
jgi:parallel beta-helix repeat protein